MRRVPKINLSPLSYRQFAGYSSDDVDSVCRELDNRTMVARMTFDGEGKVVMAVSCKTWERQEGHYGSIAKFFSKVANSEHCRGKKGSLIVWLEDGLWPVQQQYSHRAPVLAFGRHRMDTSTFLIPDPAFLGSAGYAAEVNEIISVESTISNKFKKRSMYWRGAASGCGIEEDQWKITDRGRIVLAARTINDPSIFDALLTRLGHLSEEQRKILDEAGVVGEECEFEDFLRYLYLIDVDGYSCAWKSLFLKLASNSVVIKMQGEFEQWYYNELIPWRHFVPLQPEPKEIRELHSWLINNDEAVQTIISQAHDLIDTITYEQSIDEVSLLVANILDCQRDKTVTTQSLESEHPSWSTVLGN